MLDQALADFRQDPQYLEVALKSVRLTKRKRRSLVIRTAAVRITETARSQCEQSVCTVPGPCGVGSCPYAKGMLQAIRLAPTEGSEHRPDGVESPYPTFDVDQLVGVLRGLLPHT